jgi:hypothetical protein
VSMVYSESMTDAQTRVEIGALCVALAYCHLCRLQ